MPKHNNPDSDQPSPEGNNRPTGKPSREPAPVPTRETIVTRRGTPVQGVYSGAEPQPAEENAAPGREAAAPTREATVTGPGTPAQGVSPRAEPQPAEENAAPAGEAAARALKEAMCRETDEGVREEIGLALDGI